jgi:hypothetical protein
MVTLFAWMAWDGQQCVRCRSEATYAEIGVFEEGDQVGLDGLLQGTDGGALEAQVGLEVLSNLADQALEGKTADEELGGLLVPTDLTQGDGSGLVPVRLLDTAGRGCGLASGLGGELLAGGLATGGLALEASAVQWTTGGVLTGCLLGTSHDETGEGDC